MRIKLGNDIVSRFTSIQEEDGNPFICYIPRELDRNEMDDYIETLEKDNSSTLDDIGIILEFTNKEAIDEHFRALEPIQVCFQYSDYEGMVKNKKVYSHDITFIDKDSTNEVIKILRSLSHINSNLVTRLDTNVINIKSYHNVSALRASLYTLYSINPNIFIKSNTTIHNVKDIDNAFNIVP